MREKVVAASSFAEERLKVLLEVLESLLDSPGNVPVRWHPRGFDIHALVISIQGITGEEGLEPEIPFEPVQGWVEIPGGVARRRAKF